MSVWSWKRSGWLDCAFALFLVVSLLLSLCSIGFRSNFTSFTTDISFNGGYYPEVGFFNLLVYTSSLLGMVCTALRYIYITDKNMVMSKSANVLNKIAVLPGISSFIGLLLVASFPFTSTKQKVISVQSIGAYIFFVSGILFSLLQTTITFIISKCTKSFCVRLLLALALTGTFAGSVSLMEVNKSSISYEERNETISSTTPAAAFTNMKSVQMRVIAFGLERGFVLLYAAFFLTFFLEFQKISTYMIVRPLITSRSNEYSSAITINERI